MADLDVANEVWRGSVATWECDDMGHLNTRFYVARVEEALSMLMAQLGVPGVSAPGSDVTYAVHEMHIRFHREALRSASLQMAAWPFDADGGDPRFVFVLKDAETGELKATFRLRGALVQARDGRTPVPWPEAVMDRVAARNGAVPREALPRSTSDEAVHSMASREMAERLGLTRIVTGTVTRARADAFGRMAPHHFIGGVSDGVRLLTAPFRTIVAGNADTPVARAGGAVVEFRILHLDAPPEGSPYEIWGGLSRISGHSHVLVFWMLDPISGRVLGTMESVAVTFDLDARALVRISDAARDELERRIVPSLTL